jgi:hypothetical protein
MMNKSNLIFWRGLLVVSLLFLAGCTAGYSQAASPTTLAATVMKPAAAQSEGNQPGSIQSNAAKPEGNQPGSIQSNAAKPEGNQPEAIQSNAAKPEGNQPGSIQPTSAQPEGIQPGSIQPTPAKPEATSLPITPPVGGEVSTPVEAGVSPPLSSIPTETPPPSVEGNGQTITLANDGGTVTLAPGESFLLDLGEGYQWDVSVQDESVLSREVNVTVISGAQGVYLAHKAGQTVLEANGEPPCRQNKPACLMPSRHFQITVIVR